MSLRYYGLTLDVEQVCPVHVSVSVKCSEVVWYVHGVIVLFSSVSYMKSMWRWWQEGQCGDGAVAADWRSGQFSVYVELCATLCMVIGGKVFRIC